MTWSKATTKSEIEPNQENAAELHKPINGKFQKCKLSSFINNILGTDLAGMQLISKFNKGTRFSCVINVFSKFAWAISLKDKKVKQSLKHYKDLIKIQVLKQKRYWKIKVVKFTTDH